MSDDSLPEGDGGDRRAPGLRLIDAIAAHRTWAIGGVLLAIVVVLGVMALGGGRGDSTATVRVGDQSLSVRWASEDKIDEYVRETDVNDFKLRGPASQENELALFLYLKLKDTVSDAWVKCYPSSTGADGELECLVSDHGSLDDTMVTDLSQLEGVYTVTARVSSAGGVSVDRAFNASTGETLSLH